MAATQFEVPPAPEIEEELQRSPVAFDALIKEALEYLEDPDVQDMALARMYIERGYSEPFAYWLVREAEVRHADH